jgi:exopolysaccharide production protein ExoQ
MVDRRFTRLFPVASAALVAIALGAAVGTGSPLFVAFLFALALVSSQLAAKRFPAQALTCGVFALLVANTKFRHRSASASLAGEVDGQIVLELALYALFAVTLAVVARSTRLRLRRLGPVELLLLAYVALAALSSVWSAAPVMTLARSVQLAILYAAALVYVRLLKPGQVLRTLSVPLAWYVVIFASLAAVFPWAAGERETYEGIVRFSWFSVHPIHAATFACIAVVILTVRIMGMPSEQGGRWRVSMLLGLVALVGIAVATRSRGPLVALLAAGGVAVLAQRLRGGSVALLTAAIAIAVLVFEASNTTIGGLLGDLSKADGTIASIVFRGQAADELLGFSGRGELWARAVPLFLDQPWLGHGYQGSRAYLLEAMPWAGYAHNVMLQSLLDLGLPGSILLFLVFGSVFVVGPVRGRVDPVLRVARVTVLAIGTFELLSGVSDEVFAGAPGYETLLVLTCACLAERLRRQPVARAGRGASPAGRRAANPIEVRRAEQGRRAAAAVNSPMSLRVSRPVDAHHGE